MTAGPTSKKQDLTMDINMPFGPLSDDHDESYEVPKNKKVIKHKKQKKLSMFNTQ